MGVSLSFSLSLSLSLCLSHSLLCSSLGCDREGERGTVPLFSFFHLRSCRGSSHRLRLDSIQSDRIFFWQLTLREPLPRKGKYSACTHSDFQEISLFLFSLSLSASGRKRERERHTTRGFQHPLLFFKKNNNERAPPSHN